MTIKHLTVDGDLHRQLKVIAAQNNTSVKEIVEKAIGLLLVKYKSKSKKE